MSLSGIVAGAAAESQSVLAQIQGMSATADGNFLYGMEVGVGVFGPPQIVEIPQPGGGYRRRAQLTLSVTRAQTQFSFEPKTKIMRLPNGNLPLVTYVIDSVDTHDALSWVLVLVRSGQ